MQINVIPFAGQKLSLEVETSDTIGNLKAKIQDQAGFPQHQQRLVFKGTLLEDAKTLSDYAIQHDFTLHLLMEGLISVHQCLIPNNLDDC